jgi:hypothetical protein
VLHKAPHDCARCRLGVEHNELIDVTLFFFLNPYVFSRRKPATKPQLSRKRKQHCIRERRRNAAGSIGSIQAEHDQQNKNTERCDLLDLVPAAIAKINEKGRNATKLK